MDLAACRTWCVRSAYMYARLPNVMHMDLHLLGRKRRRLPLACAPLLSVLSYLLSAAGLVPGGGWAASVLPYRPRAFTSPDRALHLRRNRVADLDS